MTFHNSMFEDMLLRALLCGCAKCETWYASGCNIARRARPAHAKRFPHPASLYIQRSEPRIYSADDIRNHCLTPAPCGAETASAASYAT